MKIGIIGAGNIGAPLAGKFVLAGHEVFIANSRGPETLNEIVRETGAIAASIKEVVKNVEVVIVSIPLKNIPLLPKDLFNGVSQEVIIIDTSNYYPGLRDEPVEAIEAGMPESKWVAEQLGRPVIKAFNSILAYSLVNKGLPEKTPGRIALPVAGDEIAAKKIVMGLVEQAGFDALDSGTLDSSWRQQPGTPAYCTDLKADEIPPALLAANKDNAPKLRDLTLQKMSQLGGTSMKDDLVNLNRSLHVSLSEQGSQQPTTAAASADKTNS